MLKRRRLCKKTPCSAVHLAQGSYASHLEGLGSCLDALFSFLPTCSVVRSSCVNKALYSHLQSAQARSSWLLMGCDGIQLGSPSLLALHGLFGLKLHKKEADRMVGRLLEILPVLRGIDMQFLHFASQKSIIDFSRMVTDSGITTWQFIPELLCMATFKFQPHVLQAIASAMEEEQRTGRFVKRRLSRELTGERLAADVEARFRAVNDPWAYEGAMMASSSPVVLPPLSRSQGAWTAEVQLEMLCMEDVSDRRQLGKVEVLLKTRRLYNTVSKLPRRSPAELSYAAVPLDFQNGQVLGMLCKRRKYLLAHGYTKRSGRDNAAEFNPDSWSDEGNEDGNWQE